jgi:hypothetical protein
MYRIKRIAEWAVIVAVFCLETQAVRADTPSALTEADVIKRLTLLSEAHSVASKERQRLKNKGFQVWMLAALLLTWSQRSGGTARA